MIHYMLGTKGFYTKTGCDIRAIEGKADFKYVYRPDNYSVTCPGCFANIVNLDAPEPTGFLAPSTRLDYVRWSGFFYNFEVLPSFIT